MKKYPLILILTLVILNLSTLAFTESAKVITLKDGSVLKGKVLELKSGVYTIETSNLGNMEVAESSILSITSSNAAPSNTSVDTSQKAELKRKVGEVQSTIMTDPDLMQDIGSLINDEEIKRLLSDPKLLEDVMSFDQDKMKDNSNIQDLMNNPKIQELMNKIQQKIPAQ